MPLVGVDVVIIIIYDLPLYHLPTEACDQQRSNDYFVDAPSQWEAELQCNVVTHWSGEYKEWSRRLRQQAISLWHGYTTKEYNCPYMP